MSAVQVALVTFAGTVLLFAVIYFATKGLRAAWNLLCDALVVAKKLLDAVKQAAVIIDLVRGELSYMRQMTQAAMPGAAVPETAPPVGRTGMMPPAFPTRAWDTYQQVPDAKPEDTDHSLLMQTEEEVLEAQAREELRDKGIEPDVDETPQRAVVEEA